MADAGDREPWTALDGIAVAVVGLLAAFLLTFPFGVGRSFREMFAEFNATSVLPPLTRLVLTSWFPSVLGAVTVGGAAYGCVPSVPVSRRRRAVVAAFLFGVAAIGVCLTGVYQPIFDLAGKVKAD